MLDQSQDAHRLREMLSAARAIEGLTGGEARGNLSGSGVRSEVERQLLALGASAERVTPEFRNACPDVAWRQFAALRDALADEPGSIDDDTLLELIDHDVFVLVGVLEGILES